MKNNIAIVGLGCRYPDARSPRQLWENVLAQRQAFRRIPEERLRLEDYHSSDRLAPDRTYAAQAAVLEGYEFERVKFRVAGRTFRSADTAHWLALDVASQALADAGFPEGEGLPRDATGVLLGNTLTGEFSRSHLMRLRWPYVRRVLASALQEEGWSEEQCAGFVERLEPRYKAPFPEVTEESLAGGLSNTIAGRISNHFDLHGGGYTVDGACASSLLAVANACTLLTSGDMEVALAGGVDLSLDPFELVGFAKTNALAEGPMRVYDASSDGFIPGEGCGFVVLMSEERARSECRHIYALIRGWGISSDGSGGLTRPEASGQRLALERAYRRAGVGIDSVGYFEGHGTGTAVGDATELETLTGLRRSAGARQAAALGSIKANIGHTKAAAGAAGLIKAVLALEDRLLPPHTGWQEPHPSLNGEAPLLRLLRRAEPWPEEVPLRAAVSAMGFGGINSHLLLEGASNRRRSRSVRRAGLLRSHQDAEVFLMAARDAAELSRQVEGIQGYAHRISLAEMTDLAAQLERVLRPGRLRAAVTASNPAQLSERLGRLAFWLHQGHHQKLEAGSGVFLGSGARPPRIGFLFSGQGAPSHTGGGAWRHRFESVEELYQRARLPDGDQAVATEIAQPAIVTSSMAGLRVLDELGIEASLAVGHSLGELSAMHWAGAFDEETLLRVAKARGQAMAQLEGPPGGMVSVGARPAALQGLLEGLPLQVASLNSPEDTVVSGAEEACQELIDRAHTAGLSATRLQVSHAFHSPLVADAAPRLAECLSRMHLEQLARRVVSTVTGAALDAEADLTAVLIDQVTSPVLFAGAVEEAGKNLDLWIEVGPGDLLTGLVGRFQPVPALAMDVGGKSLSGLLQAVAAAFAMGAPLRSQALFEGRLTRPFELDWQPRFLANPCEEAPQVFERREPAEIADQDGKEETEELTGQQEAGSTAELVRRLIAERTELPLEAVREESLLLRDLHLNSISVSELVSAAARRMKIDPPAAPTEYANATVAQVAEALEELRAASSLRPSSQDGPVEGLEAWVRPFRVDLVEEPLQPQAASSAEELPEMPQWQIVAAQDHPLLPLLDKALRSAGIPAQDGETGSGLALCLPPQAGPDHIDLLLEAARIAFRSKQRPSLFMMLQQGGGGGGFARTLHLESPGLTSLVLDLPFDHPQAVEWVLDELQSASGFVEAHYDSQGCRRVPRLRLLEVGQRQRPAQPLLGSEDVLLVSGGGKGIAAESALALARRWGARLLLVGRSDPAEDTELASNLKRLQAYGVKHLYQRADVTDPAA
ncbi:MAG: type I polyketide synthase, partial [Acidobacteriota bacterium]